jgi:hypothetical protein
MATEARHAVPKNPGAPTKSANSGQALSPEDLAEFIDSLREDEIAATVADRADDDPEYND